MKSILVLNGPNLNMLGTREPQIYGSETLKDVEKRTAARAKALGQTIDFRQSNAEAELIGWIQSAPASAAGIIINAGAYTHTSIAIHDALRASGLPVIEVHLSNIYKREDFRHKSFVSPVAAGVICGFGSHGYELAVEAMSNILQHTKKG